MDLLEAIEAAGPLTFSSRPNSAAPPKRSARASDSAVQQQQQQLTGPKFDDLWNTLQV